MAFTSRLPDGIDDIIEYSDHKLYEDTEFTSCLDLIFDCKGCQIKECTHNDLCMIKQDAIIRSITISHQSGVIDGYECGVADANRNR